MKRRTFIQSIGCVGGLCSALGLYSWQIEPFWLEFVKIRMGIINLPENLEGKSIMQISDLHIGNRFDRQYLIDALEKSKAYDPDFVVYTGDFISYESNEQFDQLENVLQHAPKGNFGSIGILGNHDYGINWNENKVADRIIRVLEKMGIRILRNENVEIQGLNFIGIDDYWGTNFNLDLAMTNLKDNLPNVVLCHNPDVVDLPNWNGYKGWILSGHTHGGQCKPPFLKPPMLPVKNKRYSSGIIDLFDGRRLYINRALGHLWQVRFNVRPEITIFEMTAK